MWGRNINTIYLQKLNPQNIIRILIFFYITDLTRLITDIIITLGKHNGH